MRQIFFLQTQKSRFSERFANIKANDGKSAQNCSEAAEFVGVHFGNFKLERELDCKSYINIHFHEIKLSN